MFFENIYFKSLLKKKTMKNRPKIGTEYFKQLFTPKKKANVNVV